MALLLGPLCAPFCFLVLIFERKREAGDCPRCGASTSSLDLVGEMLPRRTSGLQRRLDPGSPTAGQGQTPTGLSTGKKPNWESGGEGCPPWHGGSEPTRVRRGQPSPPPRRPLLPHLQPQAGSAAAWAGASLLLAEENHDTSSEKTFMR